jgi:hypothetical protein
VLLALTATLAYGLRKAQIERDIQRRLAYAADMSLAQQPLAMNDLGRARSLLETNRPVKEHAPTWTEIETAEKGPADTNG